MEKKIKEVKIETLDRVKVIQFNAGARSNQGVEREAGRDVEVEG